jgi:hypothetical protein
VYDPDISTPPILAFSTATIKQTEPKQETEEESIYPNTNQTKEDYSSINIQKPSDISSQTDMKRPSTTINDGSDVQ